MGDKSRRCTALRKNNVFCYILQYFRAPGGLGQLPVALRGLPGASRGPSKHRSAAKEACSELEESFFEDFRAKRPRSGPSHLNGTRAAEVRPPRESSTYMHIFKFMLFHIFRRPWDSPGESPGCSGVWVARTHTHSHTHAHIHTHTQTHTHTSAHTRARTRAHTIKHK